jgi:tryptophan halogenase
MKATAVDAFRGKLEDGQVVIEFGQSGRAVAEGGAAVQLSERIALAPDTAKRLVFALDDALARAASARAAPGAPASAAQAAQLQRLGELPLNATPDAAGARSALLLELVGSLGARFQYERSFRISRAGLQANRFLLTLAKADVAGDPRARVFDICRRMDMPANLLDAAAAQFDAAGSLHFGFEGDVDSIVCKLYLEQVIGPAQARAAMARSEALLQHVAFKWDLATGVGLVTRYMWYPLLAAHGIAERLAQVYRDAGDPVSMQIARSVLDLALERVPAQRLQYLEVSEDGNARRSFDLNLYDAGLLVKDLRPALSAMRERYELRPGRFQALYDQVKGRALGHVAGGMHRNGQDFFNIYHAAA